MSWRRLAVRPLVEVGVRGELSGDRTRDVGLVVMGFVLSVFWTGMCLL